MRRFTGILREFILERKFFIGKSIAMQARCFSMNALQFERAVVEVITDLATQKGVKAAPLARLAWPDAKDAPTKWRKIRNGAPPQAITVEEAFSLSVALGVSLADVCGMAKGRLMARYAE